MKSLAGRMSKKYKCRFRVVNHGDWIEIARKDD
jgi:hypothetical protein